MSTLDQKTADAIAIEAYIYLYPLVLMELTRTQMTNVAHPGEGAGRGPADTWVHVREFPPADFRDVVRPNFDTLYSLAWLDLREEPRIVSLPEAGDNYYLLPLYDMWSEIFACPGTRTNSGVAADYALCGPQWEGELPDGVERIDAPTSWVWVIGRTKASPALYDQVHAFQDGMRITPLSAWPGEAPAVEGSVDPAVDAETPPLRQVFALDGADYFSTAATLLTQHAPHFNDHPMLERMARLGFVAGESFDLAETDPVAREALEATAQAGAKRITERQKTLTAPRNGWIILNEGMGAWGTNYLKRACVDLIGLGANLPEDAIYPLAFVDADGEPFTGANSYVLRFEADALPPVEAFWSLTLYDDEGFQVANELDRFAIGDRDDLIPGDDGSVEIHIGPTAPESGTSNWLPSPKSGFNLCLRLYYPEPSLLDGSWSPPSVAKQ